MTTRKELFAQARELNISGNYQCMSNEMLIEMIEDAHAYLEEVSEVFGDMPVVDTYGLTCRKEDTVNTNSGLDELLPEGVYSDDEYIEKQEGIMEVALGSILVPEGQDVDDLTEDQAGELEIECDMEMEELIRLLTQDDAAPDNKRRTPSKDPSEATDEQLELAETFTATAQEIMDEIEWLNKQVAGLWKPYLQSKAMRQHFYEKMSRYAKVWYRIPKWEKPARKDAYDKAMDEVKAQFVLYRDKTRELYAGCRKAKDEIPDVISHLWDLFFGKKAQAILLAQDLNTYLSTGYGSEMHDSQWVNPESSRDEDEFQAYKAGIGGQNYLPNKANRKHVWLLNHSNRTRDLASQDAMIDMMSV